MNVCTIRVKASDLTEGQIVVSSRNACYLRHQRPAMRGWRKWEYTRHAPDGSVIASGEMNVSESASVAVVCVTVDGSVVTP